MTPKDFEMIMAALGDGMEFRRTIISKIENLERLFGELLIEFRAAHQELEEYIEAQTYDVRGKGSR